LIKLKKINLYHLDYPLKNYVVASFGLMKSRPALILELTDTNDNVGLGEIWCNFPSDGASYKFKLFKNIFVNKLINSKIRHPKDLGKIFDSIKTIFVQSDDLGSYNSILSAIDCAYWDLIAKKEKTPLNKLINKNSSNNIEVYASGINSNSAIKSIMEARLLGIKSFKIKTGFDNKLDINLIEKIFKIRKSKENIMLDINQGWDLKNANSYIKKISKHPIFWIEEPISAKSSDKDYLNLIENSKVNLALGENVYNDNFVNILLRNKFLKFFQPDITKYGGISLVHKYINSKFKNKIFLHFLGSGLGLITSAHIMSAINNNGLLETDFNENPLRDNIFNDTIKIIDGKIYLNNKPGIGFTLNKKILKKYTVTKFTYKI
jgi:L-alanine-DL-glutamate epimerase-like enolase superfamily enzyme